MHILPTACLPRHASNNYSTSPIIPPSSRIHLGRRSVSIIAATLLLLKPHYQILQRATRIFTAMTAGTETTPLLKTTSNTYQGAQNQPIIMSNTGYPQRTASRDKSLGHASHCEAASLASLRSEKHRPRLPHAIAHRGYKAKFPENSMGAFKGAVEVGAHAIETDLHITKDNVIVLSHDNTLKRCFDLPHNIIDCDWKYLSTLWTTREPKQRMPRLIDLLEYLARPGMEEKWTLLDIKV